MSALVMRRALFIHVPKTGGHFVQQAIADLEIDTRPPRLILHPRVIRGQRRDHPVLTDVQHYRWIPRRRFSFGFVRFPPDWWRSYWAYRMRTGWDPRTDAVVKSDEFPTFIEKVLQYGPGIASKVFEKYLGPPGKIDFVGRCEHLAEDLTEALELAGYEVDPDKLSRTPLQNTSNYEAHPAEYPPDLLREMLIAERSGIERWYPERLSELGRGVAVSAD